jgi:dTDP-glucose 4,6-dehydratase
MILITGGAGFIGGNFVLDWLEDPEAEGIVNLDKLTYAGNLATLDTLKSDPRYFFVHGDIGDQALVTKLLNEHQPRAIVNFAAESHVDRSISSSAEFVNSNIVGVQVILDAIKSENYPKRFLQVSTDEVYGSINSGSWSEDSPLMPNSPYSASKAGGEILAMSYFRTFGLDVVVTRCSNNYGPHHFPEKLIPLFVTNIIEGKKLPLYGNGKNIRDWLHVDDHCRGVHAALTMGKSGNVYNIGGGRELSNLQITKLILDLMDENESCIEYVTDRKGHDFRYSVNWTKISNQLGYTPLVSFETGLDETINWYRNNETWWKPLKAR